MQHVPALYASMYVDVSLKIYICLYAYVCLQPACVNCVVNMFCPDSSVVHASGSGQLQANPHVAVRGFPLGSPPEGR